MCPMAKAMVSTVRPKARETPAKPIPVSGNVADQDDAVAHEGIKKITDDIARAIVQSPIEYRAAAEAAVAAGARPGDLGLETDVGAEYCLRMMA